MSIKPWAAAMLALSLSACIDPQVRYSQIGAGVKAERVPSTGEYVVQAGDTLYSIAFRHELDFRDIASANGIGQPYTIFVGQRLRLAGSIGAAENPAIATTNSPTAPATTTPTSSAPEGTLSMTPPKPVTQAAATPVGLPASEPTSAGLIVQELPPSSVPVAAPSKPEPVVPAPAVANAAGTPAEPVVRTASAPIVKPSVVAQAPTIATGSANAGAWRWPANGKIISSFSATDPTRQGIDIAGTAGDAVVSAKPGEVVYSGRGIIGYGELIVIKHDDATLSAYGHNRKRFVKEGDRVSGGQQIAEMGKDLRGRDLLHFEIRRNGKPIDPNTVLKR